MRKRRQWWGYLVRLALVAVLFPTVFGGLMALLYWIAPPPRTNILILGLDAREGESMVTRTDTIILATVDPDQPYVGMLSIPRDLYVEIPGYGQERVNTANVLGELEQPGGGVALAAATIESNFGVPVHRTVRLNFEGFVAIVDAAGGVTIDVPAHFVDDQYPTSDFGMMVVEFQPGRQHMDGERALQYARIRHGDSDLQRAERQQQVVAALISQLLAPANWKPLPAVFVAFQQHVETNLTVFDALTLGPALLWVGPDGIDHRVLDLTMAQTATGEDGAAILEPQWNLIQPLLDEMFFR